MSWIISNKIIYTRVAYRSIKKILTYLVRSTKDRTIGEILIKNIDKKCKQLIEFPYIGSVPNDPILKSNGYRVLVCENYLIFYLYVKEDKIIYIITILNAKQDIQKHFEDL